MSDALVCLEVGNHFQSEGDYPAAAQAFSRAMSIDPQYARSFFCYANLNRELGQQAIALDHYNKAISLDQNIPDFFNNRALLKYEMGDITSSEQDFLEALRLEPKFILALNNLGVLYQCINQNDKAVELFKYAIQIDPDYSSSYCNLGNIYSLAGDQVKAIEFYDRAIALAPHDAHAYNAKSISLLLKGDYQAGWELQEWRWKTNYKPFPKGLPEGKLWVGKEPLANKTILIESEQGFGDSLQFCRYLPLLAQQGAKIFFRTEKALIDIMQSLKLDLQVIPNDASAPQTDFYCPLLSLPWIFETRLHNIPNSGDAADPYLFADPEKVKQWQEKIAKYSTGNPLRVGIVWAGAPRPQTLAYRGLNSRRDIPLALLTPLLRENVEFYSLQKGAPAQAQLENLEASLRSKIVNWTNELKSFADTAAFIANLDLVISVDTSIVHLAGAMGKTVLLLNRKDTCWRWLESGDHSPWYPSLVIFRQTQTLQWDEVIQSVILKVRELQASKISS